MLNEIIGEVHKVNRDAVRMNRLGNRPDIVIFINNHVWRDCMYSVRGESTAYEFEFYTQQTILGFPVFKVIDNQDGRKSPPLYCPP